MFKIIAGKLESGQLKRIVFVTLRCKIKGISVLSNHRKVIGKNTQARSIFLEWVFIQKIFTSNKLRVFSKSRKSESVVVVGGRGSA